MDAFKQEDPTTISQIKAEYYTGRISIDKDKYDKKVLIIKYIGYYRPGSEGNPDATYMYALANFAESLYNPEAIILDLTELAYEYGDRLGSIFSVGKKYTAVCVLISDLNRKQIGTLVHFGNENIPATQEDFICDTMSTAYDFLKKEMKRLAKKSNEDFHF